jgi:hypothetical protein
MNARPLLFAFLSAALLLPGAPARAEEDALDLPKKETKAKKKPAKKKGYDYEKSKYKSMDLAGESFSAFRFDANGEPVKPKSSKKKAPPKKKAKRSEPPEVGAFGGEKAACAPEEDSCARDKSGADAL